MSVPQIASTMQVLPESLIGGQGTTPTTYGDLKDLIGGLGDNASIGLNIPVVNPIAEQFQNQLLTQLQETSGQLPYYTPETAPFVAGLSPAQQAAISQGMSGIGTYQPFLDQASSLYGSAGTAAGGLGSMAQTAAGLGGQATGVAGMGTNMAGTGANLGFGLASDIANVAGGLEAGGAQAFDPTSVSDFMSPYTQDVIDSSLADIQRESDIARQRQRGEAVKSGAFGGSRQAVLDAELDRTTLEQKAQTAAELRRAGFESAAQRAQQAFEDQQGRFLSASQLGLGSLAEAGQLGLGAGQLGLGAGELGLQGITTGLAGTELGSNILGNQAGLFTDLGGAQSGLASQLSGLQALDTETLLSLGGLQQGNQQALLDALYADTMASITDPYTALQVQSDIFNQTPYTQTALNVAQGPAPASPNTGGALAGAGIAALGYGLQNLGR